MDRQSLNIYDIARRAGVSIATVSRVLSGADNVREATRSKVLAVVEETGYVPNAFARGLGLGTMRMVGILCTDVTDLYCARAVAVTERLLRDKGFDTLLYCTGYETEEKKRYLGQLLAKNVDAVLLVGSSFKEKEDNGHLVQAAAQAPVIIINGLVEGVGIYSVICDESAAMRENVRLLHDRGCRDILYLYDAETYSGMQKLAGFRQGLIDCGMTEKPGRVVRCEKTLAAARTAAEGCPWADGVLAAEDILAIGACKAFAGRGEPVPAIGFNDSVLAECATPALTSVDNMVETLCQNAAGMLVTLLTGAGKPPARVTVSARMVERETFRTAKNKKEMPQ